MSYRERLNKSQLSKDFIDWFITDTKGIRVETLKNFLLFVKVVKERFETLDWETWKRNKKKRKHLPKLLVNYLSELDTKEILYYSFLLNWSERLVVDYWLTLRYLINKYLSIVM